MKTHTHTHKHKQIHSLTHITKQNRKFVHWVQVRRVNKIYEVKYYIDCDFNHRSGDVNKYFFMCKTAHKINDHIKQRDWKKQKKSTFQTTKQKKMIENIKYALKASLSKWVLWSNFVMRNNESDESLWLICVLISSFLNINSVCKRLLLLSPS